MRGLGTALLAVMVAVGISQSLAAQTVMPTPLASGEVLLQIVAHGSNRSPADFVLMTVPIWVSADDATAARMSNQAKIDRLKKLLVASGVDAADLTLVKPGAARMGFIGNEQLAGGEGAPLSMVQRLQQKTAYSALQIKLSDVSKLSRVTDILDAENEAMVADPVLRLKDDRGAKRAAIADAATRARFDADNYAAAFGLRVIRIARISDQASNVPETNYAAMMQMMTDARPPPDLIRSGDRR
ncbi:SIMPL domain-containing protein [Rhizorhabdus argentea]|uniref:SIMPL domain-containing protein n=1 Tax=Rhizorhabdus argentea TaxID=1387174 RepID=UPI0030EDDE12